MSSFYKRVEELLAQKGVTGYKMCKDLGISRGVMTALRSGKTKTMTAENTKKIADYFGVSTNYLLGEDKTLNPEAMKYQRKRMGQSVQKMADLLHIQKETYVAYEEGREGPPQNVIDFLTYFFGVTEDYLFGRTSYPYDPNTNLVESNVLRLDEHGQKKEATPIEEQLPEDRRRLLEYIMSLDDDQIQMAMDMLDVFLRKQRDETP